MFGTESQIDASFYRLIHELVRAPDAGGEDERRGHPRRRFLVDHRVAPVRGEEFPDESAFIPVRCNDLTRSGFSFFFPSRPEFTNLVVAFGAPPETIYVGAEVIYCDDVLIHPLGVVERLGGDRAGPSRRSPEGAAAVPAVLVGCQFTERLEKPAAGGPLPP